MFSHVVIGAKDVDASKKFYDAALGALGIAPGSAIGPERCVYATPTGMFIVTHPIDGNAATHANGGTIGFAATSPEQVEAWHAAGVAAGGTACENPPGVRDFGEGNKLYLAYLRDPAGNKLCAMHRMAA
ncbi:MAG: VOC family protein [Sphingomonadaceae bacterium]